MKKNEKNGNVEAELRSFLEFKQTLAKIKQYEKEASNNKMKKK